MEQLQLKKLAPFFFCFQVAILALGLMPAAQLAYDNRVERFAVADRQAEKRYQAFSEAFGARNHFIVSLCFDRGEYDEALAESLLTRFRAVAGVDRGLSARSLIPEPSPEAEAALPFPFLRPDLGCISGLFELNDNAVVKTSMDLVFDLATSLEQDEDNHLVDVVVAGEPVVNYRLDESSREVKFRFFPILIGLSLLLLGVMFRSLKVLLITGLSVVSSLVSSLGLMALWGQQLNLVTTLIPALVFVLTIAMQVHLLISMANHGSVWAGLRSKVFPNFLVSLTTSIGFGSLMTSYVTPIAVLGKYMALSVWILFFWVHFTHLSLSPILKLKVSLPRLNFLFVIFKKPWYWQFMGRPIHLLLPLLVIFGGGSLLYHNPMESNGLNYFSENHQIRRDTTFLEREITGSSQLELLLKRQPGLPPEDAYMPEGPALDQFENQLLAEPHIRHMFSLNRFVKVVEATEEDEITLEEDALEPYVSHDYYRIQLLVNSLDKEVYEPLRERLLALFSQSNLPGSLIVTGTLDRLMEIQDYLLSSLSISLGITIVAVVLLMSFLLNCKRHVLLVFIPNLLPLGFMALAMALFSMKTTVSTVMVFSIAFGIAVDDTIHLLHSYFERRTQPFRERWQATLERDSRAIFTTTVVLAMGFLVLASSSFIPTRNFGLLLSIGMIVAFVGDVTYLPILLKRISPEPLPPREKGDMEVSGNGMAPTSKLG